MAKIAVQLAGEPGQLSTRLLSRGDGWAVEDVTCTCGPRDRPFEEQHSHISIALVVAGTFQYSAAGRRELMTPGSLMLGNPAQPFKCGHEHGTGDRCISFSYTPEYFEAVVGHARPFGILRVPPMRLLSPVVAQALSALHSSRESGWDELSLRFAGCTLECLGQPPCQRVKWPAAALARVTRVLRSIDRGAEADLSVGVLAQEARLSPYHFIRMFERLTGLTPHQYVLRTRLRQAATRLLQQPARILDMALECGFGDVSNFNRAFRTEFGMSPRAFRLRHTRRD